MDTILTPQAAQFLDESIREVLTQYQVNNTVAAKVSTLILTQFNNKIVDFFTTTIKKNQDAIIKEALEQCQDQAN